MATSIIELNNNLAEVVGEALAPSLLKVALNRAVTIAGTDARSWMADNCPVSDAWMIVPKSRPTKIMRKKNQLVWSLKGGPNGIWKQNPGEISTTIGSDLPYAESALSQDGKHSGGPYDITPKKGKYLVFAIGPNPKTDIVRMEMVTHPGAKEIGRRKTGKNVAIMTQAKERVEAGGDKYVSDAVKFVMEIFR